MDLYVNARFLPMTGEHDTFEAMLVGDDGTIAFTGSLEQARDRAAQLRRTASGSPSPVRQIDCEGHCVMPGLIDPHSHFSGATQYFTAADLSDARSFDDVTRLLTDFARRRGWLTATDEAAPAHADDGVILIGVGLDDTHLDEHRMPDRVVLDRVGATLPVVVNHVSGHNLACNTRMLQLADTPDPTGGRYLRDADGRPDGRCVEPPAMSPVFTYIQSHQRLDMHALVGDMQDLYASHGITTVQDGATTAHDVAAFAGIADHDGFRVDLVSYPMFGEDVDGVFREFARYDSATYHGGFRFGGRKLFMDGSPQARTAWLTEPYTPGAEGAGYRGHATVDLDAAYRFALAAAAVPLQRRCRVGRVSGSGGAGDARIDESTQAGVETGDGPLPVRATRPIRAHAHAGGDSVDFCGAYLVLGRHAHRQYGNGACLGNQPGARCA